MKPLVIATLGAAISLMVGVSDVSAQRAYKDGIAGGGYRPSGTCSKGGGPRANDLKNCKKEHCKRR